MLPYYCLLHLIALIGTLCNTATAVTVELHAAIEKIHVNFIKRSGSNDQSNSRYGQMSSLIPTNSILTA